MDINEDGEVEFTLECVNLSAEYGVCGSHLLDVTVTMSVEKLESFIKEYNDERHKITKVKNEKYKLFPQLYRSNNMEDSDGEDNV